MVAVKKLNPSDDTAALHSDIASFASSLGLASSAGGSAAPYSGFNDIDFRKKAPTKPQSQPPSNPKKISSPAKPNIKSRKPDPRRNPKPAENEKPDFRKSNILPVEKEDSRFKNLPKLPLVKSTSLGVWYNDAAELEEKLLGKDKKIEVNSAEEWKALVEKNKETGERLLYQYAQDYMSSRGKSGDIKMLFTTQRSGTAADKVSALSVLIGDNAVANTRSVDSLLGMVTSKVGKRHAFTAFEALKEIFLILLPNRKLKTLSQRPLNHLPESKDGYSLLLFWHWEECLKERYEHFVSALQEASLDVIVKLKTIALKTMYTMLKSKSEQERRLLSALVNKLGDPENKVASNADYHLANLLSEHPNMKAVVIDEVDNFLFRPHLGLRSKYHAVNFLTQIRLSHKGDGPKAAKRLIDIYFALFKLLIAESGTARSVGKKERKTSNSSKEGKVEATPESHVEMDSRLLSALLTGVNRAFPFVSSDEADDVIQVQTPVLFQLVHSKNFNVGVQALMLLDKISSKNQIVSDRFYRALYSKLLLPAAMNSSKEEMFIALTLRAMKNDINIKRVAAFSKRLLQVSLQLPPQYTCACLFLLSEALKARPPLWNMVLQNESVEADDDLEHFEDIAENDEKKAITPDKNKDKKGSVADISNGSDSDGDSLHDESGSEGDDNEGDDLLGKGGLDNDDDITTSSGHEVDTDILQGPTLPGGYNPRNREPTYCNADRVGWWELTVLASHVHPSVAAMAGTLLSGVNIVYNGNPLTDLSLGAFLDKLMEKKPKQNTWHGASQIEPATKNLEMNHQLIGSEILSLAEDEVPPEDVVFHKFYMNKMNSTKKIKKKKIKKTHDEEAAEELYAVDGDEDGSDEDDEEIDNLLDTDHPSLAAGDGDDYDYDDLDKVAGDDDEDLIGDASDDDAMDGDALSDVDVDVDVDEGEADDEDDGDDDVAIGEADDGSDFEELLEERDNRKRKSKRGSGASPFASLEEYQHLMEDEEEEEEEDADEPQLSPKKKKKKKKGHKSNESQVHTKKVHKSKKKKRKTT